MTSFKSKVQSEMEILEKNDRLITRYFQESRHTEDIVGIKEDLEERDICDIRRYTDVRILGIKQQLIQHGMMYASCVLVCGEMLRKSVFYSITMAMVFLDQLKTEKSGYLIKHSLSIYLCRYSIFNYVWSIHLYTFGIVLQQKRLSIHSYVLPMTTNRTYCYIFDVPPHYMEWHKKLMAHQETATYPLPAITSEMTVDQQAEALKFQRRPRFSECIQLAACRIDERLPTNPDLPADLFTSCLTTPIQMSILWYLIKSGRKSQFPSNLIEEIPGQLSDRRTILGELNWIFTAITDTIAWNTLPRDDFQRLFRQDLLLASLFRSFLLAERIMAANGCNVVSSPALPSTADHPLWDSWEYTLDLTLNHIHNLLVPKINFQMVGRDMLSKSNVLALNPLVDLSGIIGDPQESQHNWFFIEQLRAFEVWLEYGVEKEKSPHQLPVVLQVLLSQAHRQRALELLARFLDLGQWAVGYSLSVGIFPYVLKLLQSTSRELRPWLAFIWAKVSFKICIFNFYY
uniref:Rab-GAP TBC domain-containing protein n=1 Tax=Heterorhabditis bacteriophora TaxID=37862 RepID=A0A1I7WT09_HETBA